MTRYISHSQVTSALDCPVQYDLRYVGRLTGGDTIQPRVDHPRLTAGRAFHEGLLAWHAGVDLDECIALMDQAIDRTIDEIGERGGVVDIDEHERMKQRLEDILLNYADPASRLWLEDTEIELAAAPMRGYRFTGFADGVFQRDGRTWLYEAKLRGQFTAYDQVVRGRQWWWYAWAWQQMGRGSLAGVVVEEIADEPPKPVAINKDGTPSKRQSCTPRDYAEACRRAGVEVDADVLAGLEAKKWFVRHEVVFDDRGVELAGRQIRAGAQLISMYDRGLLMPIHNPSKMRCGGCAYRDVCVDPTDAPLVDALFERTIPALFKKDRKGARK